MAVTKPVAPPPPTAVSGEAVEKVVKALLKWRDFDSKSQKAQLLSSDDFVYLIVTLSKIPPQSRTNPYKLPLIHPLYAPDADGSELCLFLDDRPDHLPTSKDAKAKIDGESIPLPKVIKLSKLKTDYKPFEAKRKLCDSYDMRGEVIPIIAVGEGICGYHQYYLKDMFLIRSLLVQVKRQSHNSRNSILELSYGS